MMMTVLALVMLVSVAIPAAAFTEDDWKDNVLIENPLDLITSKKETIVTVTFLDTLENAPKWPWHLGANGNRKSVQGWIEWKYGQGHVYIAAEGGINGKNACVELFKDCGDLKEVNFNGAFHTEEAESMTDMFYKCYELETVDLQNLNTSNVKSMYQMFRECASLKTLDLSKMDTSKVESMYCMFSTCQKLEELDLSSFNTANVTNMGYMFSACTELKRVNVTSFDTSRVYYMEGMFRWCNKLEDYDFSGWDVSRVTHCNGFLNDGMKINGQKWENFFK
jgi:surface protein